MLILAFVSWRLPIADSTILKSNLLPANWEKNHSIGIGNAMKKSAKHSPLCTKIGTVSVASLRLKLQAVWANPMNRPVLQVKFLKN
jgi:hypothetical protein